MAVGLMASILDVKRPNIKRQGRFAQGLVRMPRWSADSIRLGHQMNRTSLDEAVRAYVRRAIDHAGSAERLADLLHPLLDHRYDARNINGWANPGDRSAPGLALAAIRIATGLPLDSIAEAGLAAKVRELEADVARLRKLEAGVAGWAIELAASRGEEPPPLEEAGSYFGRELVKLVGEVDALRQAGRVAEKEA